MYMYPGLKEFYFVVSTPMAYLMNMRFFDYSESMRLKRVSLYWLAVLQSEWTGLHNTSLKINKIHSGRNTTTSYISFSKNEPVDICHQQLLAYVCRVYVTPIILDYWVFDEIPRLGYLTHPSYHSVAYIYFRQRYR